METENITENKGLDLGNGNIPALFRTLFFPTLAGMVFDALFVIIDGIFVGHGIGASGIAAISIVSPLFSIVSGIGLMFGIGASVLASISLAKKKINEANTTTTQAFGVGTILMLFIAILCFTFADNVVEFLGCSDTLKTYCAEYLHWLLPGTVFLMFQFIGMMLIRLDGSPKYAMMCNVLPAIINIGLDWLFIFPLQMGLKGAAMATSLSCLTGGSMALFYFLRFSLTLRFSRLKFSISGLAEALRNTSSIVKIGFATLLTELAMSVMLFTGNHVFIEILGDNGVAAFSIACYLFPFLFSVNNSISEAIQPIISYNYGAGNTDRVAKALHTALTAAVICGIIEIASISGFTKYIVRLFLSPDTEAYRLAYDGLPLFAMCGVFFALNIAFISYYQSLKKATRATIFTLLRGTIFVVPCLLLLPKVFGVSGLWLAIPASEIMTLAVIFIDFRILAKTTNQHRTTKENRNPFALF